MAKAVRRPRSLPRRRSVEERSVCPLTAFADRECLISIGMSRYDLTDFEWRVIEPLLPNKPGGVPRVDDRRTLNGIFWVLRSGDLPERYGPRTTCYNRFVRRLPETHF